MLIFIFFFATIYLMYFMNHDTQKPVVYLPSIPFLV